MTNKSYVTGPSPLPAGGQARTMKIINPPRPPLVKGVACPPVGRGGFDTNDRNPKQTYFDNSELGTYLKFRIWNLGFQGTISFCPRYTSSNNSSGLETLGFLTIASFTKRCASPNLWPRSFTKTSSTCFLKSTTSTSTGI